MDAVVFKWASTSFRALRKLNYNKPNKEDGNRQSWQGDDTELQRFESPTKNKE